MVRALRQVLSAQPPPRGGEELEVKFNDVANDSLYTEITIKTLDH